MYVCVCMDVSLVATVCMAIVVFSFFMLHDARVFQSACMRFRCRLGLGLLGVCAARARVYVRACVCAVLTLGLVMVDAVCAS